MNKYKVKAKQVLYTEITVEAENEAQAQWIAYYERKPQDFTDGPSEFEILEVEVVE